MPNPNFNNKLACTVLGVQCYLQRKIKSIPCHMFTLHFAHFAHFHAISSISRGKRKSCSNYIQPSLASPKATSCPESSLGIFLCKIWKRRYRRSTSTIPVHFQTVHPVLLVVGHRLLWQLRGLQDWNDLEWLAVAANTSGCYLSCTRPCEKKHVEIYMEKDGESMFKQGHECLPAVVDLAAKGSMEKPGICETDMTFKSKRKKKLMTTSLDKSRTRRSWAGHLHVLRIRRQFPNDVLKESE